MTVMFRKKPPHNVYAGSELQEVPVDIIKQLIPGFEPEDAEDELANISVEIGIIDYEIYRGLQDADISYLTINGKDVNIGLFFEIMPKEFIEELEGDVDEEYEHGVSCDWYDG